MSRLIHKSKHHLEMVKEGYWEHLGYASWFAMRLFGSAVAVFIHALIPALFEYNGSRTIELLHAELQSRKHE